MLTAFFLAVPCVAADEFTDQLARLRAARADERTAAERWLSSHLVAERYPELAEAALVADAEVRGRLERVLASDARHLALALALCAERDLGLRQLGEDAVRAGVARSDPRLTEPALRDGLEVFLRRAAEASPPRNLRVSDGLELEAMLEELELAGELPLGLTLDASAASRSFRRQEQLPRAPWNRVLWRLRDLGVQVEGHGIVPPGEGRTPSGAFLRFATELGPVRTGVDWVADWLFVLARAEASEGERVRAARNLASSGFAPALTWLDGLVAARGDRAAREGCLRAAARGRVTPVLTTAAVLGPCLAEAEEVGDRRCARILAALTRIGCLDWQGEPLAAQLLADFAAASSRGRWIRLYVLERNRCASPEATAAALALLADPATPPALALQALHLCGARGEGPPAGSVQIAQLPALLRLDSDPGESERLGRALRLVGVAPPFLDPAGIPADWRLPERTRLLEAWLWSTDEAAAAQHVVAWLAGAPEGARERGESLARALAPWNERGEGERLRRLLSPARVRTPALAASLERVQLLLGLVPSDEVPALVARGGLSTSGADADLAVLGVLAGYPQPIALEAKARETLRALFGAAVKEGRTPQEARPLLEAAQRAVAGLHAAHRDAEGLALARALWQIQVKSDGPLARELAQRAWLVPPGVELRELGHELARHRPPPAL